MTFEAYTNPDFGLPEKLIFFAASLAGILLCVFLITLLAKLSSSKAAPEERKAVFCSRARNRVQLFYEMIISGTSVMSFSCAYVIINHIYTLIQAGEGGAFARSLADIWEGGRDFVLLLLICLSCVLNTILDRIVIPLKHTDKDEKASIRLLAMFYVILILVCLNQIGDESEYNPVMMYYLGLMVGRFVYFDASAADFLTAIKNAFKNISLLIMGLLLTLILCRFGFSKGYLLERNYYIVGIFYTHLFMLAAIFILHHSRILKLFIREPKDLKGEEPEKEIRTGVINKGGSAGSGDGYSQNGYGQSGYSPDGYGTNSYNGYGPDGYGPGMTGPDASGRYRDDLNVYGPDAGQGYGYDQKGREKEMSCDTCVYYEYDENDDAYYCTSEMDEDDYQRLYANNFKGCPYYQSNDEYSVVRHQM